MNKTELISEMAKKGGISKVDAAKAFNAYVEVLKEQFAKGEKISVVGFGTLSVIERAARTGINPRTKKTIEIAAKNVVKFRPSKDLA